MPPAPMPEPPADFARWPFWRRWFGQRSERFAARYLRARGYRVLAANVADRRGELDLLALDPDGKTLVDGKKLIILAGGDGAHTVALDKLTGKELWRSGSSAEMGYSPPSIIEAGGKRQLIVFRPNAVVSLDPETGKPYWSIPYTASSGQSIMTPVVSGDLMFAGGYQDKNILIKLAKDEPKAEMVWKDKKRSAIGPVGVQPIAFEGTIYGYDDSGDMRAQTGPSREVLLRESGRVSRPSRGGRRVGGSGALGH